MRGIFAAVALSAALSFGSLSVGATGRQGQQSVGLVLSGGGAKGIAHIGVIRALEDNGIPIDYIAGTSMGSIVGGLYASGYTPEEMMQLLLSKDFANWSTGKINQYLVYFFAKPETTPAMINIPVSLSGKGRVAQFPKSLISPLPMNFAFMELFSAYTAQCGGDFDNLFVPFRCVTSDIQDKHKIVCRSGHLSDAIRASMSFPVVFQPIEMDSVLVYDGGIYDNFPVDVMRDEFNPSIMIGVDVHGTTNPANARELVNQIEDMIIQNQTYDLPADEGVKIRINLDEFSLLDFPKACEIYQIGYDHAMAMMDSIKVRVSARVPAEQVAERRALFKKATPKVVFDRVHISGGTPRENEYLEYLFDKNRVDTFGLQSARLSYYRAITPGKLADFHPHADFNPSTGFFTLNATADVKNDFTVGIGGFLTSSVNSMAFFTARYNSLQFNTFDASVDAWVGQSYLAAAVNARLMLPTGVPTALSVDGVIARRKYYETDKLFFDISAPTFVTDVQAFARLRYGVAIGRSNKFGIEAGGGTIVDRFYDNQQTDHQDLKRDRSRFNLGQARAVFDGSTLDNMTAPVSGHYIHAVTSWNVGRYHFTPGVPQRQSVDRGINWVQAEVKAKYFRRLSDNFSIGGVFDGVYTNRGLLDSYYASVTSAPAFIPTPASDNSFNPAFRANSYLAVGLIPVWMINDNLQIRGNAHLFQPVRRILPDGYSARYGDYFAERFVYCELSAAYTLPFATLSVYGSYENYPARNWNCGISFGLYFLAPQFLR